MSLPSLPLLSIIQASTPLIMSLLFFNSLLFSPPYLQLITILYVMLVLPLSLILLVPQLNSLCPFTFLPIQLHHLHPLPAPVSNHRSSIHPSHPFIPPLHPLKLSIFSACPYFPCTPWHYPRSLTPTTKPSCILHHHPPFAIFLTSTALITPFRSLLSSSSPTYCYSILSANTPTLRHSPQTPD